MYSENSLPLPESFVRQMEPLLPDAEWPAFLAALHQPPPVSIRLNRAKAPADAALLPPAADPVGWHPDAYYLPERPVFTLDPLHHAGAYYVQEAASMFIYEALRQYTTAPAQLKALDLCAAPGGKSTLLAAMGFQLTANEVIRSRNGILRENLERWGTVGAAVCSAEAEEIATALPNWFDVVVVDAPCSGEGLFRKDAAAIREWSPDQVALCAGRQRRILAAAVGALAPDGLLLYSTCTYNRSENEDNVAWLQANFDLEFCHIDTRSEWQVTASEAGYRFFPHRSKGEGFFMALLRKKSGTRAQHTATGQFRSLQAVSKSVLPLIRPWLAEPDRFHLYQTPAGEVLAIPAERMQDFLWLDKGVRLKWFGCPLGMVKGKDFIPDHALALSTAVAPGVQRQELSLRDALVFLKKEHIDLPSETPLGWTLACYAGLPLGWMKVLPNRMNNYLPSERRIRMGI